MIAPGAVVLCRQTGAAAMVVERREAGGWRVVCKGIDDEGRSVYASRVAGEGDLVLVAPAPTFAVGATVMHNGMAHAVAADLGDHVELIVPTHSYRTHGRFRHAKTRSGVNLRIAGGNITTVAKSGLTLEALR